MNPVAFTSYNTSWRLFAGMLSACLVLLSSACDKAPAPAPQKGGGRGAATRINTTQAQRISIQRQVDVSGTLVSPDQARVSSEVAGLVREVLVELGQEVRPGQVLAKLEPRELALAFERAESALKQTEAQLGIDGVQIKEPPPDEQIAKVRTAIANREDAQNRLDRAERLVRQGLLPQADLDAARTSMKVNEAAFQAALEDVHGLKASLQDRRASFQLAQKKLSDAIIKAPVAGSITERLVQPGEFIRENTAVVTIVQMHPLKLKTAVQERWAGLIKPDLRVEFRVESFPERQFSGRVAFISPSVDQTTRTFTVEALVDNSDRKLKPGFFGKGVILTRIDTDAIAAPEEAISTLAGVSTVFIIKENKVRQQIVSLGVRVDKLVEIVEGLQGDEVLAISNLSQLATGGVVQTGGAGEGGDPSNMNPAGEAPSRGGGRGRRGSSPGGPQ